MKLTPDANVAFDSSLVAKVLCMTVLPRMGMYRDFIGGIRFLFFPRFPSLVAMVSSTEVDARRVHQLCCSNVFQGALSVV